MEFTIERSKWYRGQGSALSRLRLRNGMMCCVGFRCRAAGIPELSYTDKSTIRNLFTLYPGLSREQEKSLSPEYFKDNSFFDESRSSGGKYVVTIIGEIYSLNDSTGMSDEEREAKLKAEFAKLGDTAVFVD
jgi:hypothetical protein